MCLIATARSPNRDVCQSVVQDARATRSQSLTFSNSTAVSKAIGETALGL